MTTTTLRRTGALLVSAALLASLTVATVAAPATAAKPKCAGKTATIVGTNKGEVIKGTKKADVIVAKGGHDRIYGRGGNDTICGGPGHDRIVGAAGNDLLFGQTGRDKLFGGAGRDRLLGGPANDRLAGGPGNDACLQGSGMGVRVGCERPVIVLPSPVPGPTPPQPEPKTLAIAYSNLNGTDGYQEGTSDVLIAKLVDTTRDGTPTPGDTITMQMYPLDYEATQFGTWAVKSHTVVKLERADASDVDVWTGEDQRHLWRRTADVDIYREELVSAHSSIGSVLQDARNGSWPDVIDILTGPSKPGTAGHPAGPTNDRDDGFIDVIIYP